ncbi:16S rRNA (cytidine(1402)-2'-O)-methyltransferase [Patescibacteria group bacterium]|nr:16S rRNA (cytidine(1402)-2'-O)-methyltransferase [Patescibacteria group bacterium]
MSPSGSTQGIGKLSVVATPIGNLEDITLRALRVLKEADVVACEDTRVTKKLLSHFDISKYCVSVYGGNGPKKFERVIVLLKEGKQVAFVTDAGTPGVSDPGLEMVARAREAGADIEAVPGPSALAAAVSVAGLRAPTFTFYGFLPPKKGREKLFNEIAANPRASIFYESPHRILKALASLAMHLPPNRKIGLYRELTKVHEEALVGTPTEVLARLAAKPEKQRGEHVIIVEAV